MMAANKNCNNNNGGGTVAAMQDYLEEGDADAKKDGNVEDDFTFEVKGNFMNCK